MIPARPASPNARPNRNSALRPPRPSPRTVTVVSPPEISAQAGSAGCPYPATCWRSRRGPARHRAPLPRSRCRGSAAGTRLLRATWAAASRASCGVEITWFVTWLKADVAGLWRSRNGLPQIFQHPDGDFDPVLLRSQSHRAEVVASGTVGPDAMTDGSSPVHLRSSGRRAARARQRSQACRP